MHEPEFIVFIVFSVIGALQIVIDGKSEVLNYVTLFSGLLMIPIYMWIY